MYFPLLRARQFELIDYKMATTVPLILFTTLTGILILF